MRRACDLHSLGNTKGKKLEVNQDLEASDDEAEEVEHTTISVASLSRDIHDLHLMVVKEQRLIRKIAAHQRKVFAYQRENYIFIFQYLGLKLPPEPMLRDDIDDLDSDITSDEAEDEVDDIDDLDTDDTSDEAEEEVHDIDHLDSDGTSDEAEEEVDDTDDLDSDDTSDEAEEEVIEQVDSNDSTISLASCSQCIRDLELKMDRIIGNRKKMEADWRKSLAYMRERDSIIFQRLGFKPPPEPMESDVDSD